MWQIRIFLPVMEMTTMTKHLPLSTPHMSDEGFELEFIHDAFQKNWIAPLGENVTGFENDIAAYTGAAYPEEIIGLEKRIIASVKSKYGIDLHPEVEHV